MTIRVFLLIIVISSVACGSSGGSGDTSSSGTSTTSTPGSTTFALSVSSVDIRSTRERLTVEVEAIDVTSGTLTLDPID